jgi:hypothetical protein
MFTSGAFGRGVRGSFGCDGERSVAFVACVFFGDSGGSVAGVAVGVIFLFSTGGGRLAALNI